MSDKYCSVLTWSEYLPTKSRPRFITYGSSTRKLRHMWHETWVIVDFVNYVRTFNECRLIADEILMFDLYICLRVLQTLDSYKEGKEIHICFFDFKKGNMTHISKESYKNNKDQMRTHHEESTEFDSKIGLQQWDVQIPL